MRHGSEEFDENHSQQEYIGRTIRKRWAALESSRDQLFSLSIGNAVRALWTDERLSGIFFEGPDAHHFVWWTAQKLHQLTVAGVTCGYISHAAAELFAAEINMRLSRLGETDVGIQTSTPKSQGQLETGIDLPHLWPLYENFILLASETILDEFGWRFVWLAGRAGNYSWRETKLPRGRRELPGLPTLRELTLGFFQVMQFCESLNVLVENAEVGDLTYSKMLNDIFLPVSEFFDNPIGPRRFGDSRSSAHRLDNFFEFAAHLSGRMSADALDKELVNASGFQALYKALRLDTNAEGLARRDSLWRSYREVAQLAMQKSKFFTDSREGPEDEALTDPYYEDD